MLLRTMVWPENSMIMSIILFWPENDGTVHIPFVISISPENKF